MGGFNPFTRHIFFAMKVSFLLILLHIATGSLLGEESAVLNVHLIPHTHDDCGWLKTFDQYYYGANSSIYRFEALYVDDILASYVLYYMLR
jgi:Glycosyl hydrolases family 38 N-terminal domain